MIIVNSHGHLDHACGNFRFQEPVYIHEKDMELCRQSIQADDIRICTREEYSPDDMMKPGYAAIVISRGHCY